MAFGNSTVSRTGKMGSSEKSFVRLVLVAIARGPPSFRGTRRSERSLPRSILFYHVNPAAPRASPI